MRLLSRVCACSVRLRPLADNESDIVDKPPLFNGKEGRALPQPVAVAEVEEGEAKEETPEGKKENSGKPTKSGGGGDDDAQEAGEGAFASARA